ncbi:2-dehydropantoate 2-reductase [Thermodesulfobacteriota bacterium]
MRIVVFGAGAVGGYFGGRLAQTGLDVAFIARGKHLQALKKNGLMVESICGDFSVHPVTATDEPTKVGEVDVVLLGVKAWQVEEAAQAMQPMLGPKTFVVTLQNGVNAPTIISDVLGPDRVVGGLCKIICLITKPGHIQHVGADPYITFGELDKSHSARLEMLLQAFSKTTGLTAEISTNIWSDIWKKFILIAPWSGVGAVTRAPVGVFRSLPETRQMLLQSMKEVFNTAISREVDLPKDVVEKTMEFIDALPEEGTASMQRDITEGRPSELNEQSGTVLRLGNVVGVQTPVNAFIYYSLLPLEMRARGQLHF